MITRFMLPVLALAGFAAPAMAQDAGGLNLAPSTGRGPSGLARPLLSARMPMTTAQDMQNGVTGSAHQTQNQNMIAALRGDPGLLSGFQFGSPLAASRQPQQQLPDDGGWHHRQRRGHGDGPVIIDNGGALAVTVGNGNVVQQSTASGAGPIAQQQVATMPGGVTAGAANLAGGSGGPAQRPR
jgi:hypothetical protein